MSSICLSNIRGHNLTTKNPSLEAVDRGSETQLQVADFLPEKIRTQGVNIVNT